MKSETSSTAPQSETKEERKKRQQRERSKRWYANNKEKHAKRVKSWQTRNSEKFKGLTRQWQKDNPTKLRGLKKKYKLARYGLTPEMFDEMLASQNGCCAICQTDTPTKKGWFVDHCHTTKAVRGLLCLHCNSMLGHARDNTAHLSAAISYLEKSKHGGQEETPG